MLSQGSYSRRESRHHAAPVFHAILPPPQHYTSTALKRLIAAYWPSALTLAAVLWLTLSSDPVPDVGDLALIPHIDKVIHFIMFGGLTGAIIFDVLRAKKPERRRLTPTFYVVLGIVMIAFAYADEWAQGAMSNGRSKDMFDFVADSAGIVTALLTGAPVVNWVLRLTCKRPQRHGGPRRADRG